VKSVRLAKPDFSAKDIDRISSDISKILRSGWLTNGSYVRGLEGRFTRLVGSKYAVAVNSGTAALHTLVSYLGLGAVDEVVVPANTFASTANAVMYVGARLALADCDAETFNVTSETIAASINKNTKCVLVTHIAGNPCEMDEIRKLCKERNITLFEDAAHALGSTYRGRACGSLSSGAAFSLYPTKIVTSGEGGMVTTDLKELAEHVRLFRNVGRRSLGHGPILIVGHNYRMSEIHAAVGLSQMSHVRAFVDRRNRLARIYNEELEQIDWIEPQRVASHSKSSYYSYIAKVKPGKGLTRDRLMKALKQKGIETTVMFRPVESQPAFKQMRLGGLPNAEAVGRDSIVLPLHTQMTAEDAEYVSRTLMHARSD
jgi:perosamine synthetase